MNLRFLIDPKLWLVNLIFPAVVSVIAARFTVAHYFKIQQEKNIQETGVNTILRDNNGAIIGKQCTATNGGVGCSSVLNLTDPPIASSTNQN